VYALRGARDETEGVYRSVNQGQSFSQTGSGESIGCNQAWYDYAFAASSVDPDELTAGCLRIYQSSNGGGSWSQLGSGYHVDIHGLHYRGDGTLFTANDGGIWRNNGGTSWTNLNNNLSISQGYRIGVFRDDYDRVCTGRQDNGTDVRSGSGGFRRAIGADGMECFFNLTGTRLYGESQNGGFRRCNYSNGSVSGCERITDGLPGGSWNTPWAQDPNDNSTVIGARGSQMWRSANEGDDWTQMGNMGGSGSIRNFAVAPSNSNVIYAFKGSAIYRTSNGGGSWTEVGDDVSGTPVNGAVAADNPDDIWVAVSGYSSSTKVWHSTDGGQSWTNETASGLPNIPANTVAPDNLGRNGVYVGMDAGVFYKRDGMSAWQDFTDGLPNAIVEELEIARKGVNDSDRRIVASTYGRGVWISTLWDENPIAVRPATELPRLRRFSTRTAGSTLHLRFQLGLDKFQGGTSMIELLTADGRPAFREEVANFGVYERSIDLSDLGRGVYVFVLRNGENRVSRRVAAH
jgi:photosystem II stability/assembly factor-like uncharacterized protein